MIPQTFPSEYLTANGKTRAIVYSLPSVTGLTAWIDYIPVKGLASENTAVENTYAADGYILVKSLDAITGLTPFKDYIPVFENVAFTKPWSTDEGGYIPMYGLFAVLNLFANGEQGVWYDPSDLTTLFQDSAGTTPVTAVEQPVGLMLDKSKGLVLGSEKIINGSFSSSSNWTLNTSVAIANSRAEFTSAAAGYLLFQDGGAQYYGNGRFYVIEFDYSTNVTISVLLSGTGVFSISPGTGRAKGYGFATNDTLGRFQINANAPTATGWIDNISVKELPGNHAFQATSGNRPTLSAQVNLLTKTEQFDDAAWVKSGVTVASNTITASSGTSAKWLAITQAVQASVSHSMAFTFKAGTHSFVQLLNTGDGEAFANFDLSLGVVGSKGAKTTSFIESVGDGYFRCVAEFSSSVAYSTKHRVYLVSSSSAGFGGTLAAVGTETVLIRNADLRPADQATGLIPQYQRVNTSTDYDAAGFPLYLKFNGTSSSMATNSINFTATDKMTVWAGVRKLSDAAAGAVAFELSTSSTVGPGAFGLFAPFAAATAYALRQTGTIAVLAQSSSIPAPTTNTITGIGDISGDSAILRVNGTQVATSASDQGTGNFGNYPLYIGARAGSSLFFNGNLYSLIARGAQSTATQISSAETWVNTKTKAY